MRYLLGFLLLIPLSGCQIVGTTSEALDYPSLKLDAEWKPLTHLRQRPAVLGMLGVSKTSMATIGDSAYTHDLDAWLEKHPVGQGRFRASVRHEQEHSKRQMDYGIFLWVCRYSYDRKFMWKEEQIGWYYELMGLRQAGYTINVDGVAVVLKNYRNLAGRMVGFEEAKQWVQSVLTNQWKPPTD